MGGIEPPVLACSALCGGGGALGVMYVPRMSQCWDPEIRVALMELADSVHISLSVLGMCLACAT